MERTQFYSKDEIARELGISLKTLLRRVNGQQDEALKTYYKGQRLFSAAKKQYLLDHIQYYYTDMTAAGGGGKLQ